MRGDLPKREPDTLARWEDEGLYAQHPRARAGPPDVRAARRPAVRQRRDPHRPRGQQGAQGHGGQVEAAGRLRRALRAGLGLPRPADRTRGREEVRQGRRQARRRRIPREVPRIRRRADRRAAPRLQAPRRDRRLGQPVPHDGLPLRGRHAARAGEDRRARPPRARREAGALVLRLRLGAGRGGDRIRRTRRRRRSTSRIARAQPQALASAFGVALPDGVDVAVPIWTTTPWTLPASLAVTLGPELDYVLVEGPARDGQRQWLVLAEALAERALAALRRRRRRRARPRAGRRARRPAPAASVLRRARDPADPRRARLRRRRHRRRAHRAGPRPGRLRGRPALRPDRAVHRRADSIRSTAAACTCRRRRRPATSRSPACTSGRRTTRSSTCCATTARCSRSRKLEHSYPHCWRHKTPVAFRATPQWFISMEQAGLRRDALAAIGKRAVVPGLGRGAHRRHGRRPSRLVHLAPAHLGRADRVVRAIAKRGEPHPRFAGADARRSPTASSAKASTPGTRSMPAELLGADAPKYDKVTDILDVWFDSGVSHECVLAQRPEDGLRKPADLYLEGSDQHRGWFQSSLLSRSLPGTGRPACAGRLRALRQHALVGDARVEPDVEDVGDLFVVRRVGAEQFGGIERVPGIDAVALDPLRDRAHQLRRVAGAARRVSRCTNNAIGTPQVRWRRDAPVGTAFDHAGDARLAPVGEPLHVADRGERVAAQAGLFHRDEPLRRGAERDRRLVAPAMRVAVVELGREQRAARAQHLDDARRSPSRCAGRRARPSPAGGVTAGKRRGRRPG